MSLAAPRNLKRRRIAAPAPPAPIPTRVRRALPSVPLRRLHDASFVQPDGSNSKAPRRLYHMLINWRRDTLEQQPRLFHVAPTSQDLRSWRGVLCGAPGTPHESGIYEFTLEYDDSFPFVPPRIHILTPLFHPNVSTYDGSVRSSILSRVRDQTSWHPSYQTLETLLMAIAVLLNELEPAYRLNERAYILHNSEIETYDERVREYARASRRTGVALLEELRVAEMPDAVVAAAEPAAAAANA